MPVALAAVPAPPVGPTLEPGAILKQQLQNEQNYKPGPPPGPRTSPPVLVIPPPPQTPPLAASSIRFPLRGIAINRSAFLTPRELAAIYRPYIGKKVGFADLQKIIERINALYRAKGVVTGLAVLPPQRIAHGVVHIELIEGRVGRIKIKGAHLTRRSYIENRIRTAPGEIVNPEALAQALVYFNRTNQTQLRASLQPGAALGLTDILLQTAEPSHYDVQAFVDDLGVKSVGRYEGGLYFRDSEPLHIGDRLDLYIVGAAGSVSGNGLYSIPVDRSGGQLGVSYARGNIDITTGGSRGPLRITGHSSTVGASFIQPLFINAKWRLDGALYFSRDDSLSAIAGAPFASSFTNKPAIGGRAEEITPSRYLLLTLTANDEQTHGIPGLSSAHVTNGTLTAIERLPKPLAPVSLDLKSGWQLSDHSPLAPTELLQIGGFNTVRGYQQAALSGSSGYYLQLEAHRPLSSGLDVYGFFDIGAVFNGSRGSLMARGSGVGANWTWRFITIAAAASYGFDRKQVAPQDSPYQIYFSVAAHHAF